MHTRSRTREVLIRLSAYLAIVVALVVTLFPIYWIAVNSFKFDIDIFAVPPVWLPRNPTLKHYDEAFVERPFLRYALNSFIVAVANDRRFPGFRYHGRLCPRALSATLASGASRFRSGSCRRA